MGLTRRTLPFTLLLLSAAIWGVSTPITKALLTEIPPFSLAFLRFLLATVAMSVIWFRYSSAHTPIRRADLGKLILTGLFAITLNIGAGFIGVIYTTALDSITFASLTPIAIALASVAFLGEKLTRINVLGQILAFFGVIMVLGSPNGHVINRSLGDILLALSGLAWVVSVIWTKELFQRYHSLTIASVLLLIGTISFAPLAAGEYLQNPAWVTSVSIWGWAGVGFLAIFTSVVAYLAYEWGLEHTAASYAAIIQDLELLVGAITASLLLGEILSGGYVLGASMILLGIVLATRPSHHLRKAHRH